MPHIIKGCPRDKWEQVQAIQHEPFIYIMSNGPKWAGEEEDDIVTLLGVLATHPLDVERFDGFSSANPCAWAYNAAWTSDSPASVPRYIDGARLYACDGVVRFFGNFAELSHVFNIDTNDLLTIDALLAAIENNKNVQEAA